MAKKPARHPDSASTRARKADGSSDKATQQGKLDVRVNGVRVEVPPEFDAAVRRAFEAAARPLPAEMTTTQAADFLDVSRPFVVKLIKGGELPCRMVGTHRRIPTRALRHYREKMFQEAQRAMDEMTRLAQEAGLYEVDGVPPPRE